MVTGGNGRGVGKKIGNDLRRPTGSISAVGGISLSHARGRNGTTSRRHLYPNRGNENAARAKVDLEIPDNMRTMAARLLV